MKNIEGVDYTGFIDYDRTKLGKASPEAKIIWLEYRLQKVLIDPLDQIHLPTAPCHNQVNAGDQTFYLCSVTLIACAIEGVGHFLTGKEDTNGDSFKAWLARYMPDWYKKTATWNIQDWLWKSARNGLAHQLAFTNGGIECNGSQRFVEKADGQIQMDPNLFYEDFKKGVGDFFQELKSKKYDKMNTAFKNRFESTLLT